MDSSLYGCDTMPPSPIVQEILSEIKKGNITTMLQLNKVKLKVSRKFGLTNMPKNTDIIASATEKEKQAFKNVLTRKPSRNSSGVTVIAVMTKPAGCVGKCIYCPSSLIPGKETPKSYTGLEPSTMRSMRLNFDPYKVIQNRLQQMHDINKPAQKIELILQGGTFCELPYEKQKYFIKRCYEGIIGEKVDTLAHAQQLAEKSDTRMIGLTIETRPDWCTQQDIDRMLRFGTTRVELGVQHADDAVYQKTARGHGVQAVVDSTQRLKDSAFKVLYHIMPGLPGTTPKTDVSNFKMLFQDSKFRPDMIKLYPCLVMPQTPLYALWEQGEFTPYSSEKAAQVIARMFEHIPRYVRVMRIQRDIPSQLIAGGVKKSNLRQLVEVELEKQGILSQDIRSREASLREIKEGIHSNPEDAVLKRMDYNASEGRELFLSFEDEKTDSLFGFCRLRIPHKSPRKEITHKTGLIRELHVYSPVVELGKRTEGIQHKGFGKRLMQEAEKIAKEEFDCNKIVVIAGVGVREYYKRFFGYALDGPYVSKQL
jgi:elongator complex protein 3